MKNYLTILILSIFMQQTFAQHTIIPAPVNYIQTANELTFDNLNVRVNVNNKDVDQYTKQFEQYLKAKGFEKQANGNQKTIEVTLNKKADAKLGHEGYTLEINKQGIKLAANKAAGIFNGYQTLKQILPVKKEDTATTIKGCKITDYPRFGWRGLMLDVSRHFFTVDEVKAYIDLMSQYKFNVFHWHLTDDNGWRIEIKSLPKLTEVGAWRVERHGIFGSDIAAPKPGEKTTYGGFYTQEQIKDIVRYAAARNITIVPEIDIPGHSMAALAAYPEFSTKKEPKYVTPGNKFAEWHGDGTFTMFVENTLNPADEKVYDFVDKIFTEVAQLFPGEYIHMGGDECYHGYWEKDPEVQKFMKKHKIKNSHELQSYFVKRVEKIISKKGKKMMGWDEILEGGLAKGAAVMSWRGMKGGIEAAKMGHEVVMSPTTYAYLDYMQGDESVENKIYASLSLEKAYSFEPVPQGVDPKYILGAQANLWTEAVPTLPFAYYMTYPRAFATAEVSWSQKKDKNWNDFMRRTMVHFDRFDAQDLNICKAVYEPEVKVYMKDNKLMCELTNSVPGSEIYYTVNNTYPSRFGTKYTGAFEIPAGQLDLRTQSLLKNKPVGRELRISRKELLERVKK
jgi:hexosaminidase